MEELEEYVNERLDHLGIVAAVCREAGIAEWLDKQVYLTYKEQCLLCCFYFLLRQQKTEISR